MLLLSQHVDTYRVTDSTAVCVCLKHPAKRVVCLSASGLDAVLELGLEPVGGLRAGVAARPEFYGKQSPQWPNVGSWLWPDTKAIQRVHPDLILGWRFPHRFCRRWLKNIAPVYLMGGSGYEEALLRLLDLAYLTDRTATAETAIASLEQQLHTFQHCLRHQPRKSAIVMGGSAIQRWFDCYPVETRCGTLGSILKRFVSYPWAKRQPNRGEPGLTYLSLQRVLDVNPNIIFVQSYGRQPLSRQLERNPIWQQLDAVNKGQVYEIPLYWHWGNGTRALRVMLHSLLPLIYPHSFASQAEDQEL
ncbi:MAG: ABC transporter substrate-binding protein [Cyanobacteria bacterium P01_D01_bin.123]